MTPARCPACNWETSEAVPEGTALFCGECGIEFKAEPSWNRTDRWEQPILPRPAPPNVDNAAAAAEAVRAQAASSTPPSAMGTGGPEPWLPAGKSGPNLPPFPLTLSFTFHHVLLAGARTTCQYQIRNTSSETVSRIRLTVKCDALEDGQLEVHHDPLGPDAEDADPIELKLNPDVHGPVLLKCQIEVGTRLGIRTAEGKLQGVVILPATATAQEIRLQIGDNFALGAEGVNFNLNSQGTSHDLLHRRIDDAPARVVPLKERGSVFVEELAHHFSNSLHMELVRVPVGVRNVWFCHHLVTQLNWFQVMGEQQEEQLRKKGSGHCGLHPRMPVYCINQAEARSFCEQLSQLELDNGTLPPGYQYRLPTEAEWRAASGPAIYTDRELNHHAWTMLAKIEGPQVVGTLRPNEFGIYDMRGNVFEWCEGDSPQPNKEPVFGGSWYADPQGADLEAARNGSRILCPGTIRSSRIGMRVVLAPRL